MNSDKRQETTRLRESLYLAQGMLRELHGILDDLVYAAVTGDGLAEIQNNGEYQRTAMKVRAKREMPPLLKFKRQSQPKHPSVQEEKGSSV